MDSLRVPEQKKLPPVREPCELQRIGSQSVVKWNVAHVSPIFPHLPMQRFVAAAGDCSAARRSLGLTPSESHYCPSAVPSVAVTFQPWFSYPVFASLYFCLPLFFFLFFFPYINQIYRADGPFSSLLMLLQSCCLLCLKEVVLEISLVTGNKLTLHSLLRKAMKNSGNHQCFSVISVPGGTNHGLHHLGIHFWTHGGPGSNQEQQIYIAQLVLDQPDCLLWQNDWPYGWRAVDEMYLHVVSRRICIYNQRKSMCWMNGALGGLKTGCTSGLRE